MTNQITDGLTHLRAWRKDALATSVVYRRGADSVTVTATVGETVFRLVGRYGAETRVTRRDYLIDAADLLLAETAVDPRAGDRIEETDAAGTWTYEVGAPSGEPAWRWSTPDRATYRIHTLQVDSP